jgi:tetrahydromethanopterin S-methyltransferase subunit B
MSDLSPDDKAILAEHLKDVIATDRFPMSPRIKSLRAILNKIAQAAPPEPAAFPPLKPPGRPSMMVARIHGWRRR